MATLAPTRQSIDGRLLSGVMARLQVPRTPHISPAKVAELLGVQLNQVAEWTGVHRNTLRTNPGAARLQSRLREIVKVITAAADVAGDIGTASYWFTNEPIADYRHKTAAELVANGNTDAVLMYLADLANGTTG